MLSVTAMLHVEEKELAELYVDAFFQSEGIGAKLLEFAIERFDVRYLFVLEKIPARFGFMAVTVFR